MNNIISIKDIIDDIRLSEYLSEFIQNFGSNYNIEIIDVKDSLISCFDDYLDFKFSISFHQIEDIKNLNESGIDYLDIIVDLWMHSGLPDGETEKYVGRIRFKVEQIAFVLYILSLNNEK